jgi:putative acetyltransferase
VIVRRERPADRSAIGALHTAAFGGPGAQDVAEARLVELLRAAGDTVPELSFVALHGDEVVGHVTCSRAAVDDAPSLGLGPLGVLPGAQRGGVGSALMHTVLGAADALGAPALVLLGDPAYYSRFGFVRAEELGVHPPEPAWGRHFQIRPLTAWEGGPVGTFRYAPAFRSL